MKAKKHITITKSKLEHIKKDVARQVVLVMTQIFMAAFQDEFGEEFNIGPDEHDRLLRRAERYSENWLKGNIRPKEVERAWNDSTGYSVEANVK